MCSRAEAWLIQACHCPSGLGSCSSAEPGQRHLVVLPLPCLSGREPQAGLGQLKLKTG